MLPLLIVGGAIYAGIKTIKAFKQHQTDPPLPQKGIVTNFYQWLFVNTERHQQLEALSQGESQEAAGQLDAKMNKDLALACGSLGLALTGNLLNSPLLRILSIPGFIQSTMPLHKNTLRLLKEGKVSVDTIVTVIILGCLFKGYFGLANLSSVFFHLSKRFLRKVKDNSRKELINVYEQHSSFAYILVEGVEVQTPFEKLQQGDTLVVHAGETILADGTVIDGMALIDQHILTGESQLIEKETGDAAFASTMVLSGKIHILVEKSGDETAVAKIGQVLNNTIDFKSSTQLRAERMSQKTVFPLLCLGGASLPFLGVSGALAIVNSHFKHKMTTVAPISTLTFLNITSYHNILIKDGRSLELLNQVDTIVFDKTGTLTKEQPHVGKIFSCSTYEINDVLRYAATTEYKQTHPIAQAILEESEKRQLSLPQIREVEYKLGYGLIAELDSQTLIKVGSLRFMDVLELPIPQIISELGESYYRQGHSLVVVALNDTVIGAIEMVPTVRSEAKQLIRELRQFKKIESTYIISGDHEIPTTQLAKQLGIEHCFSEVLPENKADIVRKLQTKGKCICFVGDGINDAIALKTADVSISLRGASSIAVDTAQVIFMDGELTQLCVLFDIAKRYHTNMNIILSSILIPSILALGGALFFQFGLGHTIILNQLSFLGGMTSAISPGIKFQKEAKLLENEPNKGFVQDE